MKKIKDLQPKSIVPGILGHYAHGELHTFGYVLIKKGSIVPEHQHPHEQITFIVEGQLDMVIDGKAYSLTPGFFHIIPSNVRHSAVAISDCIVIDTFSPVREDYKNLESVAFSSVGRDEEN
jgi:quercetin dioxygenase-like cupin family protein